MHLLQPTACTCYQLKLPTAPTATASGPLDSCSRRRYTLDCRTGAAVELTRSDIFVHGGLTIPLNLSQVNSVQIQKELILYFTKEKTNGSNFKKLNDWVSQETFYLDLISRTWKRVETTFEDENGNGDEQEDENSGLRFFKERLFHSMCFVDSCLYTFGGLVVSPHSGYELIATNELCKLDLQTKRWSLVSKDPQITRRFTHSMHTVNEEDETKDTKIIIAGGLNNIDKPVHQIDIFNITKNCWETDITNKSALTIFSNVEGEGMSLLKESNFSILVQNNEAKIPSLAFYAAQKEFPSRVNLKGKNSGPARSPIVALPLLSESQGMRMISNPNQNFVATDTPFNLQFPTGDYFCYTIVMAGFYPNSHASSFCCFVYDIPTGKWTRVGIACKEGDANKHRFWKLFVWQSHHQTLLLGTRKDDDFLPSVQKFDFLLSFGLPMISIYNKGLHSSIKRGIRLTAQGGPKAPYDSRSSSISSERNVGEATSPKDGAFRKPSYASTSTSQFESYIRYIAPPIDMTSIRSVFPPYAMVLGKDALEIFGNPLSDFEFITDEGDSIGVPLYLLRKRWGRYFDMLLSQGYVRACAEYENNGSPSDFIKFSPHSSQALSCSKNSHISSTGSLDAYFSSIKLQRQKSFPKSQEKNVSADEEATSEDHPLSHLMTNSSSPSYYGNDEEDPVSPPSISRAAKEPPSRGTKAIRRIGTGSTTSSSGGMVFRVPFQEAAPQAFSDTNLVRPSGNEEKRRSSSVATAALDYLKPSNFAGRWRRASHPNASISSPENHLAATAARLVSPSRESSRNTSRNTSITSQNSSLSYVSSSSDRMGNSIIPTHVNIISNLISPQSTVLNVPLPPQSKMPSDPLPPPPSFSQEMPNAAGRRNSSFADLSFSNRSSPFSSRRASYDRRSSLSEVRRSSDQFQSSLDRQMMDETQGVNNSLDTTPNQHHRSFFTRASNKNTDSAAGGTSKVSRGSDANRLSLSSNPESTDSVTSAPLEWEPLLTPRTLYMPWPTATVRAFAEFFFTGQVNGKWVLAPVVLNLLLMSKIYEIPLLYNLITEVLYSIVGRKEDSLYVICASLTDAFRRKVSNYCGEDQALVQSYLEGNELYAELNSVKESLENIDNGFFDLELIKKVSRAFSFSTTRTSDSGPDKFSAGTSSILSASLGGANALPTVLAGGPRDSQDSEASINYPSSLHIPSRHQYSSARMKKKSSLSQEIGPSMLGQDTLPLTAHVNSDTALNHLGNMIEEEGEPMSDSDSSSDSNSSRAYKELDNENYDTDEEYETTIIDARTDLASDSEEGEEEYKKNIKKLDSFSQEEKCEESPSSLSESDDMNSDLGLLSLNKMKRKITGQDNVEESIDPLFRINFTSQNPSINDQSPSEAFNMREFARDGTPPYEANFLTLENLASPNALPPVDYVIKSISRTAALVNYPRLMVRCLDCLEISKRLKSIKKRVIADFAKFDEECKQATPHELLRRQILEKQKSDSALAKSMSTRFSMVSHGRNSPTAEKMRCNSAITSDNQLSPKTSNVKKEEISTKSNSIGTSRRSQTKISNENPATASNTPVLMNPAFMPPPPAPGNKGKKASPSSNSGGFSFFGLKK